MFMHYREVPQGVRGGLPMLECGTKIASIIQKGGEGGHPNLIELLSESFFSFSFFFFSSVTLRVPPPPLINFYTI